MLKWAHFFRRTVAAPVIAAADDDAFPSPDISHCPSYIAAVLAQLARQNATLTEVLIEGAHAPSALRLFGVKPNEAVVCIEFNHLEHHLVGKLLTVLSTYHESRVAFSVKVLAQSNLHRFELAWPDEILHITGRQYFRYHPRQPLAMTLVSATQHITAHLFDLSEGGIGVLIRPPDYPAFIALCQQPVGIRIAGLTMTLQLKLCNQLPSDHKEVWRLGLAIHASTEPELIKLRRLILQLQAKH